MRLINDVKFLDQLMKERVMLVLKDTNVRTNHFLVATLVP